MPGTVNGPDADLRTAFDLDPRLVRYDALNYGIPLDAVDGLIVPNDRFFIRSRFPAPTIDPASWRLAITGLVATPLELSLADLQALSHVAITAFIECSGNSRNSYQPVTEGTPWDNTAASNAEWLGTPLGPVLAMAGLQPGVIEIVTQGGDSPEMQRGLPLGKALDPNTLLVWSMNGEPLPTVHGGPVRLLVPGWGGIASTKWLTAIEVIDHAFSGQFSADHYTFINEDGQHLYPMRETAVKSVIASPASGARLEAGTQSISGYAWSGYGAIARVEVSADGGATWREAAIVEQAGPLSWVRFEAEWDAAPGATTLMARATDELNSTQPFTMTWNARGYGYNAVLPVPVTVT